MPKKKKIKKEKISKTKKREKDVPNDQEKWRSVKDKLKYLIKKPGKGD